LDIGCGAGRHSLYLQKRGFDVLGIDSSPLAIKVCKLRGLKQAKVMSIEELNFKPNSFDSVIMLGSNFGLFGSFEKARKLLKKFHKMTSGNGLIIASTRDTYKTDIADHLEYHKTKDPIYVKEILGHKDLKSTQVYIHVSHALFQNTPPEDFHAKVATTPEEITQLLEAGFEYVLQKDSLAYFRKRK
jgi:2-polyprenyl-3-methyl-5-hydroxy-6-metoxy-1,4-benzoquinol methylase